MHDKQTLCRNEHRTLNVQHRTVSTLDASRLKERIQFGVAEKRRFTIRFVGDTERREGTSSRALGNPVLREFGAGRWLLGRFPSAWRGLRPVPNSRNVFSGEGREADGVCSSPCFRVSSEAGGGSPRTTGCGCAIQMDTPESELLICSLTNFTGVCLHTQSAEYAGHAAIRKRGVR